MISHKHRCIFIHIPKCAGTSIEAALGHLDGHTGRGGQDHRTIRMIQPITLRAFSSRDNMIEILRRGKHRYFSTVLNPRNKYTVTREQYDSYFKFTFVRNPWARAFSWYRGVMRDEIHRKEYRIATPISFDEFLRLHIGKGMLRPQAYWIKDFSGHIDLDYIGRFENLAEDFQKICEQLSIPHIVLPHKIKGTGEDYRQYYNKHSIELVMKHYKEEITMFGYDFD